MTLLAVIPARGGSKGVPRKNLRVVGGRPLIWWTIEAARKARVISHVTVSTDDPEIAAFSAGCGVHVTDRPPRLAGDRTPMIDVVLHALQTAEERLSIEFDATLLLQPTCPLRAHFDIDDSIAMFHDAGAESLVSVCNVVDSHPSRMYKMAGGLLWPYMPEPQGSLRQDLEPLYLRNGAIYLTSRNLLIGNSRILGEPVHSYIMPQIRSVNIDTEFDLRVADILLTSNG